MISFLFKAFESRGWSCRSPKLNVVSVSLQASFPGNLHLVMVLRPTGFFQRTFTDIGFRFSQEDFLLKLPVRGCGIVVSVCDRRLPTHFGLDGGSVPLCRHLCEE